MRSPKVVREAHDHVNEVIRNGDEMVRPMQRDLRNIMWEHCGVVRDDQRMTEGLAKLEELREAAQHADVRATSEGYHDVAIALDLRNSRVSAEATIRSCASIS